MAKGSASTPTVEGNLRLVVEEGNCNCGCGGMPAGKKRKFRQGHDASLRSKLIKAHQANARVEVFDGNTVTTHDPVKLAAEHGWSMPLPKAARPKAAAKSKASAKSSKKSAKRKAA